LAIPIRFGTGQQIILKLITKIGLTNFFLWDLQLRKNQAHKKRFDRPYSQKV
jgi:hypothetical protein